MAIQYASRGAERADLGEIFSQFNAVEEGFVTTQVLPVLELGKQAAAISVRMRENLKRADAKHSNGGAFNRINLNVEDLTYQTIDYGLEELITDTDRENYVTDFDADAEALANVRYHMFLEQEIRGATALFNGTTFTGAALYTDVSAAPWDAAGSDAIGHILAARDQIRANVGMYPTSMLIGAVTATNLLNNTAIRAAFSPTAVPTVALLMAQLGALVGIPELIVGEKVYDSALEGQDFSGSDIWSDDYALLFVKQTLGPKSGGLGRTITWDRAVDGVVSVDMYRENQTASDVVRVRQFQQEKLFDPYYGHLLKVDA